MSNDTSGSNGPQSSLDELIAHRECENLSNLYARYFDFKEAERLQELFAEDGALILSMAELKSAKAVSEFAVHREKEMAKGIGGGRKGGPALGGRHITTNFQFELIDADHARATAYLHLYVYEGDGTADNIDLSSLMPRMLGVFHDKYVRTKDGWRFQQRILTQTTRVV